MAKSIHKGKRKAVKAAAHKAAERSASVMKPEFLAVIENFRLMDAGDLNSRKGQDAPRRDFVRNIISFHVAVRSESVPYPRGVFHPCILR